MLRRRIRRVALTLGLVSIAGLGLFLASGKRHRSAAIPPGRVLGSRPMVRPVPARIVSEFEANETQVAVGPVTYASDVATILQERCQSCHRPGQVAPFALL